MAPQKKIIKPELLGSKITTKAFPTPIEIVDTPECIELLETLKLDVFVQPTTPKADPK